MTKDNKGVELIGKFNNESKSSVDDIKSLAADLINLIDDRCPNGRRKSKAFTDIETAAMYAVKSLFEG
jgi:hypothetical protein